MRAKDRLIIALDVDCTKSALELVKVTQASCSMYKVGLELFISEGPDVVRAVQDLGADVFLDLKLHDIPNTVKQAAKSAGRLGARFLTVHALGLFDMVQAAQEGIQEAGASTQVLAVTVLTSHDPKAFAPIGFNQDSSELARALLKQCGAKALVCSALEASAIRSQFGKDFTLVCPGIRPKNSDKQDQSRIATPSLAIHNGADYLVVGRPITRAKDPAGAAEQIVLEIEHALSAQTQAPKTKSPRFFAEESSP